MAENKLSPKLQGILWILTWAALFSIGMTINKTLTKDVSLQMKVSVRVLSGVVFYIPLALKLKRSEFVKRNVPLHLVRVLLVLCAMGATYAAYTMLPLATASSIGFTAPLMITMMSVLILGERFELYKLISVIGGYAGVLVIIDPFNKPLGEVWGLLVALGANFFASLSIISSKVLSRNEPPRVLMFYTNIGTALVALCLLPFYWKLISQSDFIRLLLLGATGTFSQYSYLRALQKANPSFLAPFEYSRLMFALPLGYFILDEAPTTEWAIGSAIIIAFTYYLVVASKRNVDEQ